METKPPRGTKDILAPEIKKWQFIEHQARDHFKLYNFQEIRTPIFEHLELFQRGVGETTEIVMKQMYLFTDSSGRNYVLRPENTASVARALIDNDVFQAAGSKRYYYIGPMFRYERMQKGRYRQFHQIGVEIFGEEHPAVDAEVIGIGYSYLKKIKCIGLIVEINSVGCRRCRPSYNHELGVFFEQQVEHLCVDCRDRLKRNPLRILDCKNNTCINLIKQSPIILDFLCEECRGHFDEVKFYLNRYKISYEVNPHLVRGLDYYTKTAFEIKSGELGAQNSVLGGGRYDGLVKELEGPDVCGIGFAIGMERVILSMDSSGIENDKLDYYIVCLSENAILYAIEISEAMRGCGYSCEIDYKPRSVRSAMRVANKLNVINVIIIGEDEIAKDSVSIKNMQTGEQTTILKGDLMRKFG